MSTPAKTRISLSGQALERLLGGDTQLEIELRHQVVETFAKEYLFGIVKSEAFKAIEADWKTFAKALVTEVFGEEIQKRVVVNGYAKSEHLFQLPHGLQAALKEKAEDTINAAVNNYAATYRTYFLSRLFDDLEKKVADAVATKIDRLAEERIQAEIQRRLLLAAATPALTSSLLTSSLPPVSIPGNGPSSSFGKQP